MSLEPKSSWSEDDVRTKVVSTWLCGHGISPKEIQVEYSFSIRYGKRVEQIGASEPQKPALSRPRKKTSAPNISHPRADILVRNSEGQNLLIIEVKAPGEELDDAARDQGISYARLLVDGNIAPFVILTNGREAKIFDTITRELINGQRIPPDHPHVRSGFLVSCDDLLLRSEALETLISLSTDNLLAFCEGQTSSRMSRLRSEDLNSGKKYIPSLYVERKEARAKLTKLIDEENKRVVVIVGAPQVGKTNFVCRMVEERLRQGKPCLFYPAIGVRNGLLNELSEDFEWVLGDASPSPRFVFNKLVSVLRRAKTRIVLFIDGWNEANIQLARDIDRDCERLQCDEIQIVISLTNVAACRLLIGPGGDPSFIAQEASITKEGAALISINPNKELPNWSTVTVRKYSHWEMNEAYSRYTGAYDVTVPDGHVRVAEPYSLGAAMKLYQHNTLPHRLDEPDLLRRILADKASRAIGIEHYNVQICLSSLAREMLVNKVPVRLDVAARLWNIPIIERLPSGFYDAALLAEVSDGQDLPAVDFYYGKERDFVIAYWVQDWASNSGNSEKLSREFSSAARSEVGADALRWFFRQPRHIEQLKSADGSLPVFADSLVTRTLLESRFDAGNFPDADQEKWLKYAVTLTKESADSLVRVEAGRLVALLVDDPADLEAALADTSSLKEFVLGLLSTNEDYSFEYEEIGGEVLEAIKSLHMEYTMGGMFVESEITDVLKQLITHPAKGIREGAAACFGYAAPDIFLQLIANEVNKGILRPATDNSRLGDYLHGVMLANGEIHGWYHGLMCPGRWQFIKDDPEEIRADYEEWSPILEPIISVYPANQIPFLRSLMDDLSYGVWVEEGSRPSLDKFTIPLPFEDPD